MDKISTNPIEELNKVKTTLIDPLEDVLDNQEVMILDVDVKGGYNIKDEYQDQVISIFIEPPGENPGEQLLILEERQTKRGNEIKSHMEIISKNITIGDMCDNSITITKV